MRTLHVSCNCCWRRCSCNC